MIKLIHDLRESPNVLESQLLTLSNGTRTESNSSTGDVIYHSIGASSNVETSSASTLLDDIHWLLKVELKKIQTRK